MRTYVTQHGLRLKLGRPALNEQWDLRVVAVRVGTADGTGLMMFQKKESTAQWIHEPPVISTSQSEICEQFIKDWIKAIQEVLLSLKRTVPRDALIGEVHYWRDLNMILFALNQEL